MSSRRQINIKGVRDGILILPNSSYRLILQVSSINFELKSEAEQDALSDIYQSFLNSLAIPLQIVVRVREMDMDKYLNNFSANLHSEPLKIYREQAKNYSQFVQSLITKNKILSRQFYVVLGHRTDEKDFSLVEEQLSLSADIVSKGLSRLGMSSNRLSSIEVLDLFYGFYSPAEAKRQPLSIQAMEILEGACL